MATKIDEAKIRGMSVHDRHRLWLNARMSDAPEAKGIVYIIENIGLPYSEDKCLTMDHPITLKMDEIINSPHGVAAAIKATEEGQPAMAGIDPLLSHALGVDYGPHNMATATAGDLVARMMRTKGYVTSGRKGSLPANCVAKTAEVFVLHKQMK